MGGDLILTNSQLQAVAYSVRNIIRAESKGVAEVELVDTLDGIESFPTIRVLGGIPQIVRAPVRLLSEPAWEAVKDLVETLQKALDQVDGATQRADQATADSKAQTEASKKQTEEARQATLQAIEVLSNPPIVIENQLYIYNVEKHAYEATGQDMKGNTFIPTYDENTGYMSWTNDGGLENPPPVRIEGNVNFATFEPDLEDGHLWACTTNEYTGAGFELNEDTGIFSVIT